MTLFALIHSPFVGPLTWKHVAQMLEARTQQAMVPPLTDDKADPRPFWEQHAESAAKAINQVDFGERCVLVGHSGAGPLLPLINERLRTPASAYIFVDAGLPNNKSRLEMLRRELPAQADDLERFLKSGGLYPRWSDNDLRSILPNEIMRRQLMKEINPRGLSFFTEQLPVPDDWYTLPCGYIQFSAGYAIPASDAKRNEWPFLEFKGGHFHMLIDPSAVATALMQLASLLLKTF